jgi:acetoacetate decarboxylase
VTDIFDTSMKRGLRFGPAVLPAVTTVERQSTTVLSFVSDVEAVRELLPSHFAPTTPPVVTFMHQALHNVDYMRGRGYNLLNVAVTATFDGADGHLEAPFPLVIWESDTMPIISGRELHGNPKIYGDVSELREDGDQVSFEVAEYGAPLVTASVTALHEAPPDRVERTNVRAADACFFGWKHILTADGGVDLDYPTLIRGASHFDRAWTGDGQLTLHGPTLDEAPYSSAVVAALAALPRTEGRRAFYGVGTARLLRDRTVRLR